jgi:integrase
MPRHSEVNFYLKAPEKNGKCLIYLKFHYQGSRLVFSFGETIEASLWNSKKQRAKRNEVGTRDGALLNELLDNLKSTLEKAYNLEKKSGIPTPIKLKGHLDAYLNQKFEKEPAENQFFSLIERFVTGEIKSKGREKSSNTLANYKTVKQHLQAFEQHTKSRITFESITLDFFYRYVDFLKTLKGRDGAGLKTNTIAKDITVLKVFMAEAFDLGLTTNVAIKNRKFTVSEEATDSIYLTEKEVEQLYRHDLSADKKLEQIRDLFVVGCEVGLRYSDLSAIRRGNIITTNGDKFIRLVTKKTKETVEVPCSETVLEIMDKYNSNENTLPKAVSNQKFNEYLKFACKAAGLTESARLPSAPEKLLYECISSHTARRTFATNGYQNDIPIHVLMKITGHKTEKAFRKYIRSGQREARLKLQALYNERKAADMLKLKAV